jgi:hypothetical protein
MAVKGRRRLEKKRDENNLRRPGLEMQALATTILPRLQRPENNGSGNERSNSGSTRVSHMVAIANTGE